MLCGRDWAMLTTILGPRLYRHFTKPGEQSIKFGRTGKEPPFLPLHIEGATARLRSDDLGPSFHCSHSHDQRLLSSHEKSVFVEPAPSRAANHASAVPRVFRKQPTRLLPAPAAGAKPNRCVPLKSRLCHLTAKMGWVT